MFQWRLKLREAKQALTAGRIDEARRIVEDVELRDFLPAKQLRTEVAKRYAERAAKRLEAGESVAGMEDLAIAEGAGAADEAAEVRSQHAARVGDRAQARLQAGEPKAARAVLQKAEQQGVSAAALRDLREVVDLWLDSRRQAGLADFGEAVSTLQRAGRLAEAFAQETASAKEAIDREAVELATRQKQHAEARSRLHAAAAGHDWGEALSAAEETLALAPNDSVTLSLRRRLWREVGLGQTQAPSERTGGRPAAIAAGGVPAELGRKLRQDANNAPPSNRSTRSGKRIGDTDAVAARADRRLLWVDAVGGFLVCLDDEVLIGQPSGTAGPAVSILADLSRRHAVLRRSGGGYTLEPLGPVKLDGREITTATALGDSHTLELGSPQPGAFGPGAAFASGSSVVLKYTRPHALSATAKLELQSGHRTSPTTDAILLMAESCVLGPASHCHVRCPEWKDDVILFRRGEDLACRSTAELVVDGEPVSGQGEVRPGARIEGEDFSICVELA
ncbi:MAG: hypothetical protein AAGJ46_11520 [Planctomycetota bacterium]